jgi:hypothetical protein
MPVVLGSDRMESLHMGFIHWFAAHESILAVIVTAGVALLLICCLECSDCGCRDKDDIFTHREV